MGVLFRNPKHKSRCQKLMLSDLVSSMGHSTISISHSGVQITLRPCYLVIGKARLNLCSTQTFIFSTYVVAYVHGILSETFGNAYR